MSKAMEKTPRDSDHPEQTRRNSHYWISELLALIDHPHHLTARVTVMGVVVNVMAPPVADPTQRRPVGYCLDDGTGVIRVVHFLRKRIMDQDERGISNLSADSASGGLSGRARELLSRSRGGFPVGTCVQASGRLQRFQDQTELLAFSVREVDDANVEVERMIDIAAQREEQEMR